MNKISLATGFRSILTIISPRLNTEVVYFIKKRKRMNWNNPRTFVEKLLKLKVEEYNKDPIVMKCADKYTVREYVSEKGYGSFLNDLIAVYDRPEDIEWDNLPSRYAMKLNYACGYNLICDGKKKIEPKEACQLFHTWMRQKPWLWYAELQYRVKEKKIIVEKYLEGTDGAFPEDYKFYCFNGKPMAVLYISGRYSSGLNAGFFDMDWNYIGNRKSTYKGYDPQEAPSKPISFNEMVEAAKKLSEGFPFVRVDFYECDGKPIFGEMTFTPAGCFDVSEIDINGKPMSEFLD